MKLKFFFFFLIFLISVSFVNADIYEFLETAKNSPGQYTLAIDNSADADIIAVTSELAGELGITNNILISEISNEPNLIIVQLNNDEEKAFIKFGNKRLSVLRSKERVIQAVEINGLSFFRC